MTDAELRDRAVEQLRLTTRGLRGYTPVPGSRWKAALDLLAQIGVTPPPPTPGYPASYFTGPLGANNIVPKKQGAFLIDYPGIVGGNLAQWKTMVEERESFIGRKFDGLQTQMWWGYEGGGLGQAEKDEKKLEWINARGQIVCVSHSANFTIPQTNAGQADAAWKATAQYFKSLGFPIMLRMWWEFNNPAGFPWCVGNTPNIGAPFVQAWKRVVNIFKAEGANNVGFWWCPMEGSDRPGQESSYPGDTYVDWVGSDAYTGCYASETGCWTGYAGPGWASFEQLCLYQGFPHKNALELYGGKKPFVYGEVGCVLDPARPDLKAAWYPALVASLKGAGKQACGISFFDVDVSSLEGARTNWRVDNPNLVVYEGFKKMAADPWLNTGRTI